MANGKKIAFSLIIIIFIGLLFLRNSFKEVEGGVYTAGEYIVGEDIEPGVYDVKAVGGPVSFSGYQLNDGDQVNGVEYYKNNELTIEGEGSLAFTPAAYAPLEENEDGEIVIENSGNYIVGSQLEAGSYEMTYRTSSEDMALESLPFVQIMNEERNEVFESYQFNPEDEEEPYVGSYTIELEEGQIFFVKMSSFGEQPVEDLQVVLKKVE